jgi:hypothetical protein
MAMTATAATASRTFFNWLDIWAQRTWAPRTALTPAHETPIWASGVVAPSLRQACANANLKLSERAYGCGHCDLVIDRDVNAAVNLARYAPPPPKASPLPVAA